MTSDIISCMPVSLRFVIHLFTTGPLAGCLLRRTVCLTVIISSSCITAMLVQLQQVDTSGGEVRIVLRGQLQELLEVGLVFDNDGHGGAGVYHHARLFFLSCVWCSVVLYDHA